MDPDFSDIKMTKRPHPAVVVILTIIIMLGLQVGGYFIYQEFFNEKEEEYVEEVDEPVLEIGLRDQENMVNKLESYLFFADYFPLGSIDAISNQDFLRFAISILEENDEELSVFNIEGVIENYFGEITRLTMEDVTNLEGVVLYEFDEDDELFNRTDEVDTDVIHHRGEFEFISGTIQNELYQIRTFMFLFAPCTNTCGPLRAIYQTASDAINDTERVLTIPNRTERTLTEEEIEEAREEMVETIFIFRRVGNNFVLESMEQSWDFVRGDMN